MSVIVNGQPVLLPKDVKSPNCFYNFGTYSPIPAGKTSGIEVNSEKAIKITNDKYELFSALTRKQLNVAGFELASTAYETEDYSTFVQKFPGGFKAINSKRASTHIKSFKDFVGNYKVLEEMIKEDKHTILIPFVDNGGNLGVTVITVSHWLRNTKLISGVDPNLVAHNGVFFTNTNNKIARSLSRRAYQVTEELDIDVATVVFQYQNGKHVVIDVTTEDDGTLTPFLSNLASNILAARGTYLSH